MRSDNFDVFNEKDLRAIRDSRGVRLDRWSCADAKNEITAPRFILGVLRQQRRQRGRFLRPSRLDLGFRNWLVKRRKRFELSSDAVANVCASFDSNPGEAVREFYRHHPEFHAEYPLALVPPGQKQFVEYLFTAEGRSQHRLSDEEILWFLHETALNLDQGIAESFLLNPAWQERFPRALVRGRHQKRFLRWLHSQFPKLRSVKRLPRVLTVERERALNALVRRRARLRPKSPGINILAHFCYPSGLQRAALAVNAALKSVGVRTSCRDVPSGVDTTLDNRARWLGLEIYPTTLITIAPFPHFENVYARAGLARRDGVYRIGSWYWELDKIPAECVRLTKLVDEMWAPTKFIAEAMRASLPVPVYEMPPGVSLGKVEKISRANLGIPSDTFLFFFMFDMCSELERKNPFAIIRAFRLAFSRNEKAELLLKVTRGQANPQGLAALEEAARDPGIRVIHQLVSRPQALGYIEMCDCLVSLHRSEGFGLPLAEAMLLGKPVIATNYSGNLAFMTQQNSLLVDYEIVEITDSGPIYRKGNRWAEPSEKHAAALMREVFDERDKALDRARFGQTEVERRLSIQAAGERMVARLQEIRAARGTARGRVH
jgi:glycosyltransferase involved in cell wall biosynthesis